MLRRTVPVWAALLALLPSCGGSGLGDTLQPRYRSATGSLSRYRVVVRSVPTGRRGRTISGRAALTVQDASEHANEIEARFSELAFAGETGAPVRSEAELTIRFTLDERRAVQGRPEVPEADGATELARVLAEGIVYAEHAVAMGEAWSMPPITRPLPSGETIELSRTARVTGVDSEEVATVEVTGDGEVPQLSLDGATVGATGQVRQRFRIRAADGALIEAETETEVTLTAALADGTAIGTAVDRERSELARLSGATPAVPHDWRPDVPGQECEVRLDGMRRRFAQAPRGLDLDETLPLDWEPPQRSNRTPIEEGAPLVIGTDRASLQAAMAEVDQRAAVAVYVLAPSELSDRDVRQIFTDVSSGIELRRVAAAQIVPPSPPRPAGIVRLRGQMRREGVEPWDDTMRALLALCPAASTAYREAMEAPAAERAGQVRDGVLAGLERCGCEVTDLGRLERVMDLRLGAPQIGWAPLQRAPRED